MAMDTTTKPSVVTRWRRNSTSSADDSEQVPTNRWGWAVLPAGFVLTAVFVLPVLLLAANSLHPNLGLGEVGSEFTLANYVKFLSDPFYLGILLRTFAMGLAAVFSCAILAYPVAYFLARMRGRGRSLMIFLVVSPMLISLVIRNLGWFPILGDNGLVNWLLLRAGLIDHPIHLTNNLAGVVIGLTHACLPFMILALTVVIQKIDFQIEEAAVSLGARPWHTFFRVVLPLSRPGLIAGSLLVLTMTISAYTTPAMLGGNRVLVMSTFIANEILSVLNYPFGATAAVILVVVTACIAAIATLNKNGARS